MFFVIPEATSKCSFCRMIWNREKKNITSAAGGNKSATNLQARLAAIEALKNYPTPELLPLIRQLEKDEDEAIRNAAAGVAQVLRHVAGEE